MSKWVFAGIFSSIALAVASAAFFYKTPDQMQRAMLQAVAQEPRWSIQGQGTLAGGTLHLDFLKRGEGQILVRIAYPPLKLLNNQWIAITQIDSPPLDLPLQEGEKNGISSPARGEVRRGGSSDLFDQVVLTQRLTTLKDLWQRVERFEFLFSAPPQISGTGTLWLDGRTRLPTQATLQIAKTAEPVLMHLTFSYDDSSGGAPVSARPVSEVIAQLQEVAAAKNGKPKRLPSLKSSAPATGAFTHDFDQDGLSDALEVFYGTDAANPDTDDDTFLDGVEVERGYNPAGNGHLNGS